MSDPRNSLRHILDMSSHDIPSDEPDTNDEQPRREVPMYTSTTTTTRRNANGSVSSVYSGNKIRHLKKEDGVPLWRKDIQYDFLRRVFDDDTRVFHKVSDGTAGHTFADIYLDAMAKSSKCSKILKDKLLTERNQAVNMAMVCLLVNVGRMNTTLNFFPEMRAQLRTYHSIPSLQAHQDPNSYKQLQDAPRLKSILKGASEDTVQPSTIDEIKAHPVPRTNPVNLIFVLAQYAPKISELHFFPPRDFFDLVMREALSSESRAKAFLWLMWWYLESAFTAEDAMNNPFGPGQPGNPGDPTGGMPIKTPPFKHLTEQEIALENVDTEEEKAFGEEKKKERTAILATDMAPVVTGPKRGIKKGFTNNPVFSVASDDGSMTPARDNLSPAPQGSFRSSGRNKMSFKPMPLTDYGSDTDRTRSASPPSISAPPYAAQMRPNMDITALLNDDNNASATAATPPARIAPTPPVKGPGRGNWGPRNKATPTAGGSATAPRHPFKAAQHEPTGSPSVAAAPSSGGPHGYYLPLNGADPSANRKRPPTAHQVAVERYRKERVDYILDQRLRAYYKKARKRRERDGAFARVWKRLKLMPSMYDSEDEFGGGAQGGEHEAGGVRRLEAASLAGFMPVSKVEEDCGEEMAHWAQIFRRTGRRLERWEDGEGGGEDGMAVGGGSSVLGKRKRRGGERGRGDERERLDERERRDERERDGNGEVVWVDEGEGGGRQAESFEDGDYASEDERAEVDAMADVETEVDDE